MPAREKTTVAYSCHGGVMQQDWQGQQTEITTFQLLVFCVFQNNFSFVTGL